MLSIGSGLLVGCALALALEFLRSLVTRPVCVPSGVLTTVCSFLLWISHPDMLNLCQANPPAFLAGTLPIVGLWLWSRWAAREPATKSRAQAIPQRRWDFVHNPLL